MTAFSQKTRLRLILDELNELARHAAAYSVSAAYAAAAAATGKWQEIEALFIKHFGEK